MKKVYCDQVDRKFYLALKEWCAKESLANFKRMYHDGFDSTAFFGFRIWRIIRNTISGRYRRILYKVRLGGIVVKN